MAQTSWPFENVDTSETQFSQWARNFGEGVINGKGFVLEPFADSSGMNVKVKSGQALIRGHYYDSNATETLTIAAANATNPRIDRVVLRLNPTTNTVILAVITGTPAASPTAPALTQTDAGVYELAIAQVAVAANALTITPANVTDQRTIFNGWTAAKEAELNAAIATVQTNLTNGLATRAPLRSQYFTRTADYTLTAADNQNVIRANSTGAIIVTVPANVFQSGDRVDIVRQGTGTVTFLAGAGLELLSKDSKLSLMGRYSGATLMFYSPTIAYLIGDLS